MLCLFDRGVAEIDSCLEKIYCLPHWGVIYLSDVCFPR
jgi:hypothetical protein